MRAGDTEGVRWGRHGFDVLAFLIGIGMAWVWNWEARDLVWSLWLSSLLTGYWSILGGVAPFAFLGFLAAIEPGEPRSDKVKYVGLVVVGLALFIGFFSFHFGAFHAGHAVFLNLFFPLPDEYTVPFSFWPPTTLGFAWDLVPLYGFFVVAVLLSQRDRLIAHPAQNLRTLWRARQAHNREQGGDLDLKEWFQAGDLLAGPYKNVIRMHLLIFFFAFIHFLEWDSFVVFAVVYAVYFFPWPAFVKEKRPGADLKS